jgi:hypothetical protein
MNEVLAKGEFDVLCEAAETKKPDAHLLQVPKLFDHCGSELIDIPPGLMDPPPDF